MSRVPVLERDLGEYIRANLGDEALVVADTIADSG